MSREFSMTPITYRGHTKPLAQWSRDLEIPYETLRMRMSRGETDPEKLLRRPRNYWRPTSPPKRFDISVFDDMFPPAVVEKLREISRQSGLSTLDVVTKIVTKKVNELLPTDSKTS